MYNFLPLPSPVVGSAAATGFMELEPFVDGAVHGDELGYLFGNGTSFANQAKMEAGEVDLSNAMIKYWTNFAKTG